MTAFRRLLGSLLALALTITTVTLLGVAAAASPGPVAISEAREPTTYATRTVLTLGQTKGEEGMSINPGAEVFADAAPASANRPAGDLVLQRLDAGSTTWVDIATGDASNFSPEMEFFYSNYTGNATYRVYYAGGETSFGTEAVWTPSYSNEVAVQVKRSSDFMKASNIGAKAKMSGKLTNWAKKKVLVETKPWRCKSCRWQVYARPRTDGAGRYSLRLKTSRQGILYRATAPATTQFLKTRETMVALILG